MMQHDAWILESKIGAPAPPARWLRRQFPGVGKVLSPLTVIEGGPGDGKTLAMLDLVKREEEAGSLVLWLGLDAFDAEPATFFPYLLHGMRRHIPDFGEELAALVRGERLEPRRLWQAFFQAVAAYNLPGLVLALDDAHHLAEQPALLAGLGYFLDKLPPRCHVLVATRRRLPLPLSRLRAAGRAVLVGPERLRFTVNQVETFLYARAPMHEIPAAWRARALSLEGWPLGLNLVVAGEGAATALDHMVLTDRALSAYVTAELYGCQPALRQEFMRMAALLHEITPEACRWILQAKDAGAHLAELEADHLILRLAGGEAYRFPSFLQEFLTVEAERVCDRAMLGDWHRRAGGFYMERGRHESAISHLIASADWAGAVEACELSFPAMRHDGRHSQIERWLERFPATVVAREPALQLWRGHCLSRAGGAVEEGAAYELARELYVQREDGPGEFKVLVRQMTLAARMQDTRRFNQLLLLALARQEDGSAEDVTDLHLARGMAADLRGDHGLMRECNEAVLNVAGEDNLEIAASHIIAHLNLFTVCLHAGDLAHARSHIDRVAEGARLARLDPFAAMATVLLAYLDLTEGDVTAATTALDALPPYWKDLLDWHMAGVTHTVQGAIATAQGAWRLAEGHLQTAMASFRSAGFEEGLKVPVEQLCWLAVARKQYERVPVWLALAETPDAAGGPRNHYDMALALPQARALHLNGQPEAAKAVLDGVIPEMERTQSQFLLVRARLYEAAIYASLGDWSAARQAKDRANDLIDAHGYSFLRREDVGLQAELAAIAAHFEALPIDEAPAAADTVAPPAGLSLCCFGRFQVRLGEQVLEQWPRRKARLLLAALALHPDGLKEQDLGSVLEPDDPAAGLASLRTNLPALRRLLEPQAERRAPSHYVVQSGDLYHLVPNSITSLDLADFAAARASGDALAAADAGRAAESYERALAFYRGHLLDEPFFAPIFDAQRESLCQAALTMLRWLAAHYQAHGDAAAEERVLKRATELAPCDELFYELLMRHHASHRRPDRVRQAYWDCRKALKLHRGQAPSADFEATHQTLSAAD